MTSQQVARKINLTGDVVNFRLSLHIFPSKFMDVCNPDE
jgi:hypothetical protein